MADESPFIFHPKLKDVNISEARLGEDSQVWHTQRVGLEQERDALRQRADDLEQQNTCLHSQLATLSKGLQIVLGL